MNVAKILINQIVKKLEKRYQKEITSLFFEMDFINKTMNVTMSDISECKDISDADLDSADIFISLIHKKMKELKLDTNGIKTDLVVIDLTLKPDFSDDTKYFYSLDNKKQFINIKNILS
jgi:hypothetical protein